MGDLRYVYTSVTKILVQRMLAPHIGDGVHLGGEGGPESCFGHAVHVILCHAAHSCSACIIFTVPFLVFFSATAETIFQCGGGVVSG